MIEKMKKATVIVLDSHRREAVEQMRDAGVLHIEMLGVESQTVQSLQAKRQLIERAVAVVSLAAENASLELPGQRSVATVEDHETVAQQCEELIGWSDEIRNLREERERLERDAARLEPWGDFNPQDLALLQQHGVKITLHTATPKEFQKLDRARLFPINSAPGLVYFAQIRLVGEPRIELDETPQPTQRLADLRAEIERINERIAEVQQRILDRVENTALYRAVQQQLDAAIEFEQVHSGMADEGALAYVTGFVPLSEVPALKAAASRGNWGLLLRDPDRDDVVPTRIKNAKPIRIIQPVFELMGTVPGYRELDISFFFLVFFTGFFAMIIGDAGYGLILLAVSLYVMLKTRAASKPVPLGVVLLTLLSAATIVWGAVTGTWFGHQGFAELPFLSWMIVPELYSFNPQSAEVVQWVCFVIGAVHLAIAHGWTFLRQLRQVPRIRSLAQLGWLTTIVGLYHLVLTVVLGYPIVDYALYLIVGGFGAVIVFSMQEQGRNFFKGILKGVANVITLALDGVSAFSDIISYIRLFAVGLATVEIAASFNSMAAGMAEGVFGTVAAVGVLFLGHTLNLAMAALAVIVHGVRLNMLEFSGHLGMEWSGVEYTPFQKSS
ncbi:MAG: V-type ATP synthase subunit I [Spirochaetaceae bacterium]|nr:MAG: V-type ATP synthase subunit I [Spirochaetaceae bacterium]